MQPGRDRRKLPHHDLTPDPEVYVPPPFELLDARLELPIHDEGGHLLTYRQDIYRGKIVNFAIMHQFTTDTRVLDVARIDCCHGVIHRHVFNRRQDDVVDRQPIHTIIVDGTEWDTVDAWFEPCANKMDREWESNVRRWNDDWK